MRSDEEVAVFTLCRTVLHSRCMTLEETRRRNDTLRTEFKGGRVLMSTTLRALPARLRGQALWHMSQYQAFDIDSDHGEGLFIHGGIVFHWHIDTFAGGLAITLSTYEENEYGP